MDTNSFITTYLTTHNGNDLPFEVFPNADYHFGKIDVHIAEYNKILHVWDVKFSIDCSGSMSDKCKDGKTKMQHIKHTISNILRMFSNYQDNTFNVCVYSFDSEDHPIFEFTHVTKNNINELLSKIDEIYPNSLTNILLPITTTNIQMEERKKQYPDNKRLHILLTDGVDSCNNTIETVSNAVNSEYEFIVFGFGVEHDVKMLSTIGSKQNCDYGFIDDLEKAGLVYGEHLHNVLYRIIENVKIVIENGEIYDWKTNVWSDTLSIGCLSSSMVKTFYVRTKHPRLIRGELYGNNVVVGNELELLDKIYKIPDLIDIEDNIVVYESNDDLTKDIFRYKTLELLYESKNDEDSKNRKIKLRVFFNIMKKYINENGLCDDNFMNVLLDDIYITYKTTGTRYYSLYSTARQRSQGRQDVCTASQINDLNIDTIPYNNFRHKKRRCFHDIDDSQDYYSTISRSLSSETDDDNDDEIVHESRDSQSAYASPSVLRFMYENVGM